MKDQLDGIDVAIEFTTPAAAPGNIMECITLWESRSYPAPPVGMTGFLKLKGSAVKIRRDSSFMPATFSIGVNILFAMNRKAGRDHGSVSGICGLHEEVHHVHKLDAPSGTAITLAEQILEADRSSSRAGILKKE